MKGMASTPDAFFEGRVWRVVALVAAVFALFGARLFQLQVLQGEALAASSQRNSIRSLRLPPPRGEIVDREGRILATTRPARHLEVVANEVRAPERTFPVLERVFDREPGTMREAVGARRGRERFQPYRLVEDLSFEELAAVESLGFAIPGVFTGVAPRRFYPNGSLAAHVLGTLGEIQADQLKQRRFDDYHMGDEIGQSGIEAVYEDVLQGRAGGKNIVVDVAGREIGDPLDSVEAVAGDRLELTLDLDLQRAAEEGFAIHEEGELKSGAVVALDPRTGDVLALVSAPAYNPNDFADGIDPGIWAALNEDPQKPLQNRAISGQYPPGSTYKAFVAAAALSEGVAEKLAGTYCPGHFRLGRRVYRCWRRQGHGAVDLREAIMKSCDVFFYRAGLELKIDVLARYARSFGFGRLTQIALPGESGGLVPTSEWKERRFREPWVEGETLSAAIGQGFNLATPLQLAVGYAAVANGGKVLRPRLMRGRVTRDGSLHAGEPVEVISRVAIDDIHLREVRDGLEAVVMDQEGTGKRARVEGLEVAGKTGTAQVVALKQVEGLEDDEIPRKFRDHALFASFAPARDPQIVVVVVLEHGGGGGANAAPIAQRVLATWFEKHPPPTLVEEQQMAAHAPAAEAADLAAASGGGHASAPGGASTASAGLGEPDAPR